MLSTILRWLTGDVVKSLTDAYIKTKDTEVEKAKVKGEVIGKQLEAVIQAEANATQIRMASAGFAELRIITFFIALPFVVHLNAVGLDTIFGFGWKIAAFPKPMDEWEGAIVLSFFGIFALNKGVQAIAAAFVRR